MSLSDRLNCLVLLTLASLLGGTAHAGSLRDYNHIVVILQENHSFDNLWGLWDKVEGEPVNGLPQTDAAHKLQIGADGKPFDCLYQNDINLKDVKPAEGAACAFANAPFDIEAYIKPQDTTCPNPYGESFTKQGIARRIRQGPRRARRLHARSDAQLLQRAISDQRRRAEPLCDGKRRGRPRHGLLRHAAVAALSISA